MRFSVGLGLLGIFSVIACNGRAIGQEDGAPDASPEAAADAPTAACCPIDPERAGCMHLGGANLEDGASCVEACDFFCSESWRIENDAHGCPTWKYDVRQPTPDEGPQCTPRDAGASSDASADGGALGCGNVSCDPVHEYCYVDSYVTDQYRCAALPANCGGHATCDCVEAAESQACGATPGLPTCAEENGGVVFGCAH